MTLKVTLTPLEPYFFGNERSFRYGATKVQKAGNYYINSDPVPSQTTLFGALRYLGIADKQADYTITPKDKKTIGESSFNLLNEGKSDFGQIKSISPLYLCSKNGDYFLKAPFDHQNGNRTYTPYGDFVEVETSAGTKTLPRNYDAKKETVNGYINIETSEIIESKHIFKSVERVGIDTDPALKIFFKKSFISLTRYSFVFFAEVDDEYPPVTDRTVFLGQGKSAFSVNAEKTEQKPETKFCLDAEKKKAIAVSDCYIGYKLKQLYASCSFAVTQTKDFRVFTTNYDAKTQLTRFDKSDTSIKLIAAGSVFLVSDEEGFMKAIKNDHAEIAGFNNYIMGGSKQ